MARKRRSSKNKKSQLPMILGGVGGVLLLAIGAAVAMKPSDSAASAAESRFSVADYRMDASRLTGNTYRLKGRVENIETLGNDRLVAVSLPNNKQERLPLLVRSGVTGRVNLTRGDSFVFDVVCRNGQDEQGLDVKGIMIVESVSAE
ncbi:MAG: hypothetical protein IKW19_00165 [Akkermansia sp.]|jgi:hypothetical protein|nr:hypothetical protein [Akkermansia sp.]